jgi:parallel beta-helix repeat protein
MNPLRRDLAVPVVVVLSLLAVVALVNWRGGSPPESSSTLQSTPRSTTDTTSVEVSTTTTTTTTTTPPPSGPPTIVVAPEDDLAVLAASQPAGTTFVLAPGIHRSESITPHDAQVFIGRPGAVLSGAVVLTEFVPRDDLWVVSGQSAEGRTHGECGQSHPRCFHSEDLFVDDQMLTHVGSISQVGPGTWFFDYGNDTIYLGEDPVGRVVELSVLPYAFRGDADDVAIRDLVIEKYAAPAQEGAIDSRRNVGDRDGGEDWVISGNVVRWNHGVGIASTSGALVEGNLVYENGQLGLAAKGSDVTITANEVYGNNTAGFSSGWEAGGSKFAYTSGLLVEGNSVHDNAGPGLWTDIDNIDTVYRGNTVIDNEGIGILHEISYDAIIANNEVRGNGFGFDSWVWGAGIAVSTSVNVEVFGNIVEGNADGIVGVDQDRFDSPASYGPLLLENLAVHDNVVIGNDGWTGIGQDIGDNSVFTSRNNRFYDNVYEQAGKHFFWLNDPRTFEEWQAFGQN